MNNDEQELIDQKILNEWQGLAAPLWEMMHKLVDIHKAKYNLSEEDWDRIVELSERGD